MARYSAHSHLHLKCLEIYAEIKQGSLKKSINLR